MPKISIITPIYCDSDEKINWLDEMIQSVVSQTVTDWELILINDKSPLLLDYIKSKYSGDNRLRWLDNAENSGPAMTRNTAVVLAESECILPLDSDDMLASNEVLEIMYDAWIMDRSKIIYGNVQLYRIGKSGSFERSKVFQLAEYSFEGTMNLEFGIMPVSTMHSKEAHYKAGGWKPILTHGREDLEYWIACGKAGYCGQKINYPTLLYRKHEQSRDYRLKFELKELRTMQQKIKDMHSDIYRGEFPMACCGKGKANAPAGINVDPAMLSSQNITATKITELSGYDDKDLEWVSYQGPKSGSFSILVRGPSNLPSGYQVLGTGHMFQIHKRQHDFFSQRQHMGFRVNQPDPRNQIKVETPKPERVVPRVVEVPKPELSTVVSLDRVGSETRETTIMAKPEGEIILEPNASDSIMKPQMPTDHLKSKPQLVSNLNLSEKLTDTLIDGGFATIEGLIKSTPQELSQLPGIGIKRAMAIIDKAKRY